MAAKDPLRDPLFKPSPIIVGIACVLVAIIVVLTLFPALMELSEGILWIDD